MARPHIWRSVKWLTPEGEPPAKGQFYLEPVLTPLWEPSLLYERRVEEFFERRENAFAHVADATRKREARPDRSTAQITRERERDKVRKQIERDNYTQEQKARAAEQAAQYVRKLKPFIGIDGEGAGEDAFGRQNYVYIPIRLKQVAQL
jgi:hypothetical protein